MLSIRIMHILQTFVNVRTDRDVPVLGFVDQKMAMEIMFAVQVYLDACAAVWTRETPVDHVGLGVGQTDSASEFLSAN